MVIESPRGLDLFVFSFLERANFRRVIIKKGCSKIKWFTNQPVQFIQHTINRSTKGGTCCLNNSIDERYFIGVDLAFSPKNNSGVVILGSWGSESDIEHHYVGSKLCKGDDEILGFLEPYLIVGRTIVAVDAPLVVTNQTGMRECERAVGRMFGGRDASAYPANLGNMAGARGPELLRKVRGLGIPLLVSPDVGNRQKSLSVLVMETYPHAGHLALFELPGIWKYKKKSGRSWELCNHELVRYWRQILKLLPGIDKQITSSINDPLGTRLQDWMPSLAEGSEEIPLLVGKRYKEFEDLTDGLFCAYVANHLDSGKKGRLFSPDSSGALNLSRYEEGQDFIVVPSS